VSGGRRRSATHGWIGAPVLSLLLAALWTGLATAQTPAPEGRDTPQQGDGDAEQEPPPPETDAGAGDEPSATSEDPPPAEAEPAPPAPKRYRDPGELDTLFSGWLGSGLAERVDLGRSAGDRPIAGLVFGGSGERSLAERPTVLLLGGLDGVSTLGSEAVLRVVDELLAAPERLPSNVAFLAVPWANPDGLARSLASDGTDGRNDEPRDQDGDGAIDEDGPDDLDGDGLITSLLLEEPGGPLARAEDDRLLRPARPGDAPRYALVREGRDDDGDGRFNEDGPGGVVPDLDFPVDWRGPWAGAPTGPWPLASPAAKSIAELVLGRRVAIALLFQGSHGGLASPGGVALTEATSLGEGSAVTRPARGTPLFPADRVAYELAERRFAAALARAEEPVPRLMDARGEERPGAALDWLYLARGVLALEVAAWGPEVETAARARPRDARFATGAAGAAATLDPSQTGDPDARLASEIERAWAAWVDNTRGGIGFQDWQPIQLGPSRAGWVGGWLPHTRVNPPADLVSSVTQGLGDFVRRLSGDVPRLEIEVEPVERNDGDVCVLRARVRNRGGLASGVGVANGGLGAVLTLDVPDGAEVLVGDREHDLGHLAGGGASAELSWVLLLPENAAATLRVETPWLPPVVREVRP